MKVTLLALLALVGVAFSQYCGGGFSGGFGAGGGGYGGYGGYGGGVQGQAPIQQIAQFPQAQGQLQFAPQLQDQGIAIPQAIPQGIPQAIPQGVPQGTLAFNGVPLMRRGF